MMAVLPKSWDRLAPIYGRTASLKGRSVIV
jgi:hypothetical protein